MRGGDSNFDSSSFVVFSSSFLYDNPLYLGSGPIVKVKDEQRTKNDERPEEIRTN